MSGEPVKMTAEERRAFLDRILPKKTDPTPGIVHPGHSADYAEGRKCDHLYRRFRPWPVTNRYRCIYCGLVTRLYDGLDRMAQRPIYRGMTVAMKGVNTWKDVGF